MLNELPEEPENKNTADGRPATRDAARARLARCLCADSTTFNVNDAVTVAQEIRRGQLALIAAGVEKASRQLEQTIETIILSGRGEFLARGIFDYSDVPNRIVSMTAESGQDLSRCAPAHALAILAREGIET